MADSVVKHLLSHRDIQPNGCWNYTGYISPSGYGRIPTIEGKRLFTHRAAYYYLTNRQIHKNRIICHKCNNRACINPDHLYQGTPADNFDDQVKAGTFVSTNLGDFQSNKTHCPKGHEYNPQNTGRDRYGYRKCKACNRARATISNALAKQRRQDGRLE